MKTIYRSQRDKKVMGVCGGLSEAFGIDSTIVRLVTVVATIFSSGAVIPVYIIAGLVMPKDPTFQPYGQMNHGWVPPVPPNPGRPGQGAYNPNAQYYGPQPQQQPFSHTSHGQYGPGSSVPTGADLDGMMNDLEKKALQKEIEQLKMKLAKFENDNKGDA
ncbi:PspC domain-containing protein [Paenibacillus thermotolerans]|uniref:PspC domain-containing protein n=1 Tax=Paenibacillus thermotolerans TaxID=3027807 RepID=UPI002368682E|nr:MULTISPECIES: PspC domain-containing protein [unclassified Paenibacillus]